ncbi:type IV pilin PilA [Desulfocucumis palustris]|uniref:Type IV pilin PilA n=1 Tax=Desulfocucumis palustris TaxID=1898651 RepID=A0A2L2XEU8_9FIRM|nr:prepilin-type N-terminal cleavage/methylation domain-containing protein [Desulfocucumis palustris]GBF32766.1 type IV pilin PilA [Desulfocucumis palustris]
MKWLHNNKGLTLVELLVAMSVLVILTIAFTAFFGQNITSISESGQKSKATAEAEKKLERLHHSMDDYDSDPEYVSSENVLTKNPNRDRNFSVDQVTYVDGEIQGYKVTVVVFYKNGERHVTMTSFIEGGT